MKLSYPFFHADRIHTPTLFMGGEKDFNVPLLGGEQMYQALRSLGVDAEAGDLPGQFHGITMPSYKKDRLERYLDWYGKFLKSRPRRRPPAGRPAASSLRLVFVRAEDILGRSPTSSLFGIPSSSRAGALRLPCRVSLARSPSTAPRCSSEMACVIFGFGWDVESVMVRVPGIE